MNHCIWWPWTIFKGENAQLRNQVFNGFDNVIGPLTLYWSHIAFASMALIDDFLFYLLQPHPTQKPIRFMNHLAYPSLFVYLALQASKMHWNSNSKHLLWWQNPFDVTQMVYKYLTEWMIASWSSPFSCSYQSSFQSIW